MFELVYGNAYTCNHEESNSNNYDEESMLTSALDFLETVENDYMDENNKLPDDWFDTIFWKCNKI